MSKEKKILRIESIVLIVLWVLIFSTPMIFNDEQNPSIRSYYVMWIECSLIGIAYILHRFLLMHRLFFAKRYIRYTIYTLLLIVVFAIFIYTFDGVNLILSLFDSDLVNNSPYRSPKTINDAIGFTHRLNDIPGINPRFNGGPMNLPGKIIPPNISLIIVTIFILILDLGIGIAVKWIISEQKQTQIESENISAKLSNLQNQVSPHFLMNTLNNIHALVDIDPKRAQKTIIELSGLMDYLLYESSNLNMVSIQKEIDFTNSYINLMHLRYPKRVQIDFECKGTVTDAKIPPLLFLNFIENTFKYGVDYTKKSFISIRFDIHENEIEMNAYNSNHSATVNRKRRGLGIENSRNRLELLFGENYTLKINDNEDTYHVKLKIPIL